MSSREYISNTFVNKPAHMFRSWFANRSFKFLKLIEVFKKLWSIKGKTLILLSFSCWEIVAIWSAFTKIINAFAELVMAGGKRPLAVKAKASKETAVEDKETPFGKMEDMDERSDDDDTSDSSVYSELDGKRLWNKIVYFVY